MSPRLFPQLLAGAGFGFLLSKAEATSDLRITGMFLFQDYHLAGVMGVAIAVAALGLWLLQRGVIKTRDGSVLELAPKTRRPGQFAAGLLFGAGWALSGTCPGTALAQLGEFKLQGLFVAAGILAGTFLYLRLQPSLEAPAQADGSREILQPQAEPSRC